MKVNVESRFRILASVTRWNVNVSEFIHGERTLNSAKEMALVEDLERFEEHLPSACWINFKKIDPRLKIPQICV